MMLRLVLRSKQDIQCSAGLCYDPIIAKYTADEYYFSPSVPSGCELVKRYGNLKYFVLVVFIHTADVILELQQRLHETRSVTHTTFVKTGRPRAVRTGVNEGATIAALERQPCRIARNNAKELDPQRPGSTS